MENVESAYQNPKFRNENNPKKQHKTTHILYFIAQQCRELTIILIETKWKNNHKMKLSKGVIARAKCTLNGMLQNHKNYKLFG